MIISLPKHFHLYRDFVKVCSRLAFGAYMYVFGDDQNSIF